MNETFDVLEKAKVVFSKALEQSEAINPGAIEIALKSLEFIREEQKRRAPNVG
jgi:hypothetical protein